MKLWFLRISFYVIFPIYQTIQLSTSLAEYGIHRNYDLIFSVLVLELISNVSSKDKKGELVELKDKSISGLVSHCSTYIIGLLVVLSSISDIFIALKK